MNEFSREIMLIGEQNFNRLKKAKVTIFGVGGVGGYAAEGLARAGVGSITLVDHDVVSITNINRQIIALHSSIGRAKVDVMGERLRDINPAAEVIACKEQYGEQTSQRLLQNGQDYIADAIDMVSAKIHLIERAKALGIPIISCMGAGNKLGTVCFEVADIYETSVCPLAKVMRRELRARGIETLKVVYSKEAPISPLNSAEESERRATPGSMSYVPAMAGLVMAGEIIRDLLGL